MTVRYLKWAGFIGASLLVVGCAATKPAWSPAAHRALDLPTESADLLTLADTSIAELPRTPDSVDRSLAALEALEGAAVEPHERHWRIGRAAFHLADLLDDEVAQRRYAELGVRHATLAVASMGERVEGHYYLALNLAKVVEVDNDVDGIKTMLEAAKRAAEIAPGYDEAGPLRLIGKVYMVAPEWPTSVGDRDEAVEVLKKAVSLAPTALNRLFLGQAFFHTEAHEKALPHVRRALKAGKKGELEARWVDEARSYLMRMGASE